MIRKILPLAARAVWVDHNPVGTPPGIGHRITTDEFFSGYDGDPFDMIFIDADHSYKSVRKDLLNSLKILVPGGTIILHDTDPSEAKYTDPGHCNDCYKILDDLVDLGLDAVTLPTDNSGMTIVCRTEDLRSAQFLERNL